LTIQTAHDYAQVSIRSVQNERFESCVDKYQSFVDKYPNSDFLEAAEKYYVNSTDFLSKFATRNN
jgi:outer membrane protein assembly factor BamD